MCDACLWSCDCVCQSLVVIGDTDYEGNRHDRVGCTECHHEIRFR